MRPGGSPGYLRPKGWDLPFLLIPLFIRASVSKKKKKKVLSTIRENVDCTEKYKE